MNFPLLFHPFFFILYSILSLLAANLGVIRVEEVIRPLFLCILVMLFILFFLWRQERDWAQAGLICSCFLFFFFSYGHIHLVVSSLTYSLLVKLIPDLSGNNFVILMHPPLIIICIGLFLGFRKVIHRYYDQRWDINKGLNLITAIMLVWPIFQIVRYELNLQKRLPAETQASSGNSLNHASSTNSTPDIYYIILDGYARKDILGAVYNYKNDPFLDFLKEQGFQIIDNSMSNYSQTVLSVASSLNMDYLDSLSEELDSDSRDVNWLISFIRHSMVREFLEGNGYQIVTFESGYDRTEIPNADIYLQSSTQATGTFESLWLQTTAFLILEDTSSVLALPFPYAGYQAHMARIKFILQELPSLVELPSPKFVFAHILIPHPPFVFDSKGEALTQHHKFGLRDGSDFQGTPAEYIEGYRQQLEFVNSEMELIIPELIFRSSTPPVIIIQGDHGPAAYLDWKSPQANYYRERMAILNAILLPGNDSELPSEELSPVNSFRVIFNKVFGTNFMLLENKSYFSTTYRPFNFVSVTEE